MNEYSYICVAEDLDSGSKFLVRSVRHIKARDIVVFKIGLTTVHAEVIHSAFLRIGCKEEAMLAEFGEIREVDKVYELSWEKEEEETEDGN